MGVRLYIYAASAWAEPVSCMQGCNLGSLQSKLSQADIAHLLGLAWEHGFASWHGARSVDEMWEGVRSTTRVRIEVASWQYVPSARQCMPCRPGVCLEHGFASCHRARRIDAGCSLQALWPDHTTCVRRERR